MQLGTTRNRAQTKKGATNGSTHNQCSLEHILGSTTTSLTLIGANPFDDYGARSQEPHSTSQSLGPWGGGPCPQASPAGAGVPPQPPCRPCSCSLGCFAMPTGSKGSTAQPAGALGRHLAWEQMATRGLHG